MTKPHSVRLKNCGSIPISGNKCFRRQSVQTGYAVHSAFFPKDKAPGAWSWPLVPPSTWIMNRVSCNSIPSYTFTVWCSVQNRNFTLTSLSIYRTERYSHSPMNSMRITNNFRGLVHNFHTIYLSSCNLPLEILYKAVHITYKTANTTNFSLYFH